MIKTWFTLCWYDIDGNTRWAQFKTREGAEESVKGKIARGQVFDDAYIIYPPIEIVE